MLGLGACMGLRALGRVNLGKFAHWSFAYLLNLDGSLMITNYRNIRKLMGGVTIERIVYYGYKDQK
jgi:hypothetical protein